MLYALAFACVGAMACSTDSERQKFTIFDVLGCEREVLVIETGHGVIRWPDDPLRTVCDYFRRGWE